MQVEVFVDPACGWSQVAVGWLQEVASGDPTVEVQLAPFSLLLRDGTEGRPAAQIERRGAGLRALRVLTAIAAAHGPRAVGAYWDAVVAQDGPVPFTDLAGAVTAAGVDGRVAEAADDDAADEAIRRSMARAFAAAGREDLPIPGVLLDGTVLFTGPLLRSVPPGDEATSLFAAVETMARTSGFYELSRSRPSHPEIPGLPTTPAPPRL